MTVLTIIGILLAAFIVYVLVDMFNDYTYKKYKYEFFAVESFIAIAISYALLFFGNKWYSSALISAGDTLNGIILISLSIIILLVIIYKNFKQTSFFIGLVGTIFQMAVYVVLTIVGIFALFIMLAFLAQTKPVYNLNN